MSMQLANLYAHHHPYIINLDDLHQMDLARSDKRTMIDEICYKCFDSIFLRLLSTLHLLRLLSNLLFFTFFSFSSPFFPFFSARAKSSKYPSSLCRLSFVYHTTSHVAFVQSLTQYHDYYSTRRVDVFFLALYRLNVGRMIYVPSMMHIEILPRQD